MNGFVQMPTGLILPERHAEARLRAARRPRAMDFFAGGGGFSCGFIQAGYEVVAAAEYDANAVITYMTNLCRWGEVTIHFVEEADRARMENALSPAYRRAAKDGLAHPPPLAGTGWIAGQPRSTPGVSHIFMGDVRKLTSQRILDAIGMEAGELDAVMGGPPCQGYSTAGKRNVYDPRNGLVFEYARFICELRPKAMVMEEVPNILNMVTPEGHGVVDQFCRILEDGGFGGFEALKRSLAGKPDARAALRGGGTRRDRKKAGKARETGEDDMESMEAAPQADLFGATEAAG